MNPLATKQVMAWIRGTPTSRFTQHITRYDLSQTTHIQQLQYEYIGFVLKN